jgi:hypothetical protein
MVVVTETQRTAGRNKERDDVIRTFFVTLSSWLSQTLEQVQNRLYPNYPILPSSYVHLKGLFDHVLGSPR